MDQDLHQNQNNQKPQTIGGVTFSAGLSHTVTAQVLISQVLPSQLLNSRISLLLSLLPLVQLISLVIILLFFLLLSPPQRLLQLLKTQLMPIKPIITLHQPLPLNKFSLPTLPTIFIPMTVPILLVKMASRRLPVMAILILTRT